MILTQLVGLCRLSQTRDRSLAFGTAVRHDEEMATPADNIDASFSIPSAFASCPDRHGTGAEKWDRYASQSDASGREIIPFWVADMDFRSPDCVLTAIRQRADHAVFGYTHDTPEFATTLAGHLKRQHDWEIDPSWVMGVPGIVNGLAVTARLLADSGDGIATFTPVYPPFLFLPRLASRQTVPIPLIAAYEQKRWLVDWDALEANLANPSTKIFWLCQPHNPTGTVFSKPELSRLADLAEQYGVTVVSDEIWADLVLDESTRHVTFASLDHPAARRAITFVAASKTWNIAGLGCAAAIIPDEHLRKKWRAAGGGLVPMINPIGYAASEAAWREGDPWRRDLLKLLRRHRQIAVEVVNNLSDVGISCISPQATYLLWLDCRQWAAAQPANQADPQIVCETAGIGPSDGRDFGSPGFIRLNLGCPTLRLEEGLVRLRHAFGGIATLPGQNR